MNIRIEKIPAGPIVYMRRIGSYGEQNYTLMQDMKEWIRRHNLWSENGAIYGIAQDNAAITPLEQCRYDVCFVTERTFYDKAILHGTLPPGAYLVAEIPHTAEEVGRCWGCCSESGQTDR
jgi:DNA gyrase inhibitor GyrI